MEERVEASYLKQSLGLNCRSSPLQVLGVYGSEMVGSKNKHLSCFVLARALPKLRRMVKSAVYPYMDHTGSAWCILSDTLPLENEKPGLTNPGDIPSKNGPNMIKINICWLKLIDC